MSGEDDHSGEDLKSLMKTGLRLHREIEGSDEPVSALQDRIKTAILMFEDATRLVSIQDMFSRNESVQEIPTNHLKYLLLPAILGDLTSKIVNQDRLEVIRTAEIYYADFLQRLVDYEVVPDLEVPKIVDENDEKMPPILPEKDRMMKLKRYKEKKEIEIELKRLEKVISEYEDDDDDDNDTCRSYYLKLIKIFALNSLDELHSFTSEKPILKHMAKMKANTETREKVSEKSKASSSSSKFQPIIITRDAIQKKVYGMGYPNIPVMSIEEFYEQRVRDGWFPAPGEVKKQQRSLMDKALDEEGTKQDEEKEEREKEEKIERDDEETLARARSMDEYKDDHKRGEGNRHNKG